MPLYLSYGRHDSEDFAKRLTSWLRLLGYDPWLDTEHNIPIGSPISPNTKVAIKNSDFVLALISQDSVDAESITREELSYANTHNIPILPVRLAEVSMPIQILTHKAFDLSADPDSLFLFLPGILDTIAENSGSRRKKPVAPAGWWESTPAISFHDELKQYGVTFTGREWLYDQLNAWIKKRDSRVLLIAGEPGIGKSAFAARIATRREVNGFYVFSPSVPDSCRPESFIATLVFQFANQFPEYRQKLDEIPQPDSPLSSQDLFRILTRPLFSSKDRDQSREPFIIIIDGLDEAVAKGGPAMLDFLEESLQNFPSGFRVIALTRPDSEILNRFQGKKIRQISINASSVDNRADVTEYLRGRVASDDLYNYPGLVPHIQELAAGNFLYAKTAFDVRDFPGYVYDTRYHNARKFPAQLGKHFETIFRNRFLDREIYEREIAPILAVLITTLHEMPREIVIATSGLDRKTASRALSCISQFLKISEDTISLFHPGLIQWLREDPEKNPFAVSRKDGCHRIAETGLREVRGGTREVSDYFLLNLLQFLIKTGMHDELSEVLREDRYITPMYKKYRRRLLTSWTHIENLTPLRIGKIYAPVVKSPSRYEPAVLETVGFTLFDRGYYDDAMILFRELEQYCRNHNETIGMLRFRCNQAVILRIWGELDRAEEILISVEPQFRKLEDPEGLMECLRNRGLIHHTRGNLENAMKVFREQESIGRASKNESETNDALGNQALVLRSMGQLREATKLLEGQREIYRKNNNTTGLAKSGARLALILMDQGRHDAAMPYFWEMEQTCRQIGDRCELTKILGNQGCVHYARGNLDEAEKNFQEQDRLLEEMKDREGIATSLGNRGCILKSRNDLEGALDLFMEQERICRELGSMKGLAISFANQALICHEQGKSKRASRLMHEAHAIVLEHGYARFEEKFRTLLQQMETMTDS